MFSWTVRVYFVALLLGMALLAAVLFHQGKQQQSQLRRLQRQQAPSIRFPPPLPPRPPASPSRPPRPTRAAAVAALSVPFAAAAAAAADAPSCRSSAGDGAPTSANESIALTDFTKQKTSLQEEENKFENVPLNYNG